MFAPLCLASSATACVSAFESTIAPVGENNAAIPFTLGSCSLTCPIGRISSPGTPFFSPRLFRSYRCGTSGSLVATTQVPTCSHGTPRSAQNRRNALLPCTHSRPFSVPGLGLNPECTTPPLQPL